MIAPTLRARILRDEGLDPYDGAERCRRELRALLALERAARLIDNCDREFWCNTGRTLAAVIANKRALSRLERVSRPKVIGVPHEKVKRRLLGSRRK